MESPFQVSPEAFVRIIEEMAAEAAADNCTVFEVSPADIARAMKSFEEIAVLDDCTVESEDADWDGFCDLDVDDGQPTEYDEWQSFDPDC